MRPFALMLLLVTVPLARGTFQPGRAQTVWRGTGVDQAFASRFLSTETCYARLELHSACRAAFAQAALRTGASELKNWLNKDFTAEPKADVALGLTKVQEAAAARGQLVEMVLAEMVNEALRFFDPHTHYEPLEALQALMGSAAQDVHGIGIDQEVTAAGVFVRRVHPGSPAAAAGLLPNDRLHAIDGAAVGGGTLSQRVLRKLNARAGSVVKLEVERAGERFTVSVVVTQLSIQSLTFSFLPTPGGTYASAELRSIPVGACENLRAQLEFARGKVKGLILDLRGNQAGRMEEVACILGLFSDDRRLIRRKPVRNLLPVEYRLDLNAAADEFADATRASGKAPFASMPMVALINPATASGAEMLAAALQDHKRAWLVGEISFGKGVTQAVVPVPGHDSLRLIYTIARIYRPSGGPIHRVGVVPNFILPFRSAPVEGERTFPREADFFPGGVDSEPAPPWRETRPESVRAVQSCARSGGLMEKISSWHLARFGFEDRQKAFALAALRCSQ